MSLKSCIFLFCVIAISYSAQATKVSKKPIEINLNWKAEPEFGGFFDAALNNRLDRPWQELSIVEGGASTPTVQMVAAGKINFAIANGDEVAISKSLGTDVVAVFATYQKDPHGVMVRADSPVKSLKDLLADAQYTVALQRGIGSTLFIQKKFAPIKAKIVPYTGGISTFLNDPKFAQQCFVTSEPLAANKQGKPAKSFLVADEGYNPYSAVLITTKRD
jgi:NitT/TauT family transport system substrate-binding protein